MKTAFLIPTGNGLVRDPQSYNPLPVGGAVMPLTTYWKRRIMFGEVVIGTPPSEKKVIPKNKIERKEEDK